MISTVHAVTKISSLIIASRTASHWAVYAAAAALVIWVVGTQKIVPTLEDGLRCREEYTLPLEDARAFRAYGFHSSINKLLIVTKEFMPDRTTRILVKENLGF